jgi:uncharacterized phiE125 gp8 family phage protein
MMLVEETTVPDAALPVTEFKAHLRHGTGFSDDGLQDAVLTGFLRAAMAAIEGRTGKILIERTFVWTLESWRDGDRVNLPVAPVHAITAFDIVDAVGTVTTIATSTYRLMPDMHQPVLLALSGALPVIPTGGTALIGLMAGYGPEWSDLPADLAQAVMLLAAHYYEYRNDMALGRGCMPFGVTALIERYRMIRLSGGRRS